MARWFKVSPFFPNDKFLKWHSCNKNRNLFIKQFMFYNFLTCALSLSRKLSNKQYWSPTRESLEVLLWEAIVISCLRLYSRLFIMCDTFFPFQQFNDIWFEKWSLIIANASMQNNMKAHKFRRRLQITSNKINRNLISVRFTSVC